MTGLAYVSRLVEAALDLPTDPAAKTLLRRARKELDQLRRQERTAAELERARERLRGGR